MTKQEVLRRYYGYDSFRPGQESIVDALLEGKDVLCVMPTGAGKSICYQVPALLKPGVALVISPLISLMKDQVGALVQNGIRAAYLNSSLTASQQSRVFTGLAGGAYRILYVAPERLSLESFRQLCAGLQISLIAVDEAHCVSQWGQDFRPSYLQITEFVRSLPVRPPVSAFTATATARVKRDIEELLELQAPLSFTTGFDRPNLFFSVRTPSDKDAELLSLLHGRKEQHGIIYCATRKSVEEVCDFLCEHGFSATAYHAGLPAEERRQNQDDFLYDRKNVMVATNAFGMGIDKSNVSYVIHYQMPKNIENYYQEAGRAGRDGSPAECILLFAKRDVQISRYLILNAEPNEALDEKDQDELRKRDLWRLKQMKEYATSGDCLRGSILRYFGERAKRECGACGNCCRGQELRNITLPSQMLLSCVARTGQCLPLAVIRDILLGAASGELETQTTFGLLKEETPALVEEILRFLIGEGYLASSGEEEILTLTERSAEILRQRKPVAMLRQNERKKQSASKAEQDAPDEGLLRALKETRSRIAAKRHVPPYLVFTDATLADLCRKKPRTAEELLSVSGVGLVKLEQYGSAFLQTIAAYESGEAEGKREWTAMEDEQLLEAFYEEQSVFQIARRLARSTSEITKRLREKHLIR